jgi:hypothetical protein
MTSRPRFGCTGAPAACGESAWLEEPSAIGEPIADAPAARYVSAPV